MYRNAEKGIFEDVTSDTKTESKTGGNKALFFDFDHDGDLDFYETGPDANLMFRNNGDGTFTEQAEQMGLSARGMKSSGCCFR